VHNRLKGSIVRYFCVFLLGAFALTAAGCGGNGQATSPTTTRSLSDTKVTTTQVEVEDAVSEEEVSASVTDGNDTTTASSEAEGLTDEAGTTDINGLTLPTVEKQVILENFGVIVTAVGMKNHPEKGACLILSVENQSDKNIWVGCHRLAVNNLMVDTMLYTVVEKGESKEDILPLDAAYLAGTGISNIGELDMVLGLYDSDSLDNFYTSDVITLHTSDFADMDEQPDRADEAVSVFDQEDIRVSYCGTSKDEKNKVIYLLIENNRDVETDVIFNSYLANDKQIDYSLSSPKSSGGQTLPGTRILVETILMNKDLENTGISGFPETFGFEVEIYKSPEYDEILMNVKVDFPIA
jgi:hypothetical protein